MKDESIIIQKANGDKEEFDVNKLKTSLIRSKASESEAEAIAQEILPSFTTVSVPKKFTERHLHLSKNKTGYQRHATALKEPS